MCYLHCLRKCIQYRQLQNTAKLINCSNFETAIYADNSVLTVLRKNINCLQKILNCE